MLPWLGSSEPDEKKIPNFRVKISEAIRHIEISGFNLLFDGATLIFRIHRFIKHTQNCRAVEVAMSFQQQIDISADSPSSEEVSGLCQTCDELRSLSIENSSSQNCEEVRDEIDFTNVELPPPHRFVKSSVQRNKYGFKSLTNKSSPNHTSYLYLYRQAQREPFVNSSLKAEEGSNL